MPVKGGYAVDVPPWVTVIILSNCKAFEDIYDDSAHVNMLYERFNVCDMVECGIKKYSRRPERNLYDKFKRQYRG